MFKRSTKETHSGQGWSTEGRVSAAAAAAAEKEEEEEESGRRKHGGKGMGLKKRKGEWGVTVTGAVLRVRKSAVPIPYSVSLEDDIF